MLKIEDIWKQFDAKRVLCGVSFDFPARAVTSIAGPSGSGKTTLLNIILGLLAADRGRVVSDASRVGCVFQEDRLIEHRSAMENLRLVLPKSTTNGLLVAAMEAVGLEPNDRARVSTYSGGMRRRVAILRATLYRPELLVLDEPFKGLDAESAKRSAEFILKTCPDATILLVTHDPDERRLLGARAELKLTPALDFDGAAKTEEPIWT